MQTAPRLIASALRHWPLSVAVVLTVALGLPMLLFPLGPDQAIFAYIAHRISHGGYPYVDAWDQKPPAIYLLYVIAINFPGPIMRNVRLFDLFMLCLTLLALYLLTNHLWGRWAAGFAAALYGAAYATVYGWWHTAQPDGYTALPLCLATWLYYRYLSRTRAWPYLLAGALTGFAFQLRFFSALIGLALLYIEWNHRTQAGKSAWRAAVWRIACFSLGFGLLQALIALYLLSGHALGAYLFSEFKFASHYARLGGEYSPDGLSLSLFIDAARSSTVLFLTSHVFITVPAIVALLGASRIGGDRRTREIGLIALTAYSGVLIQAKFFWYHWLAVLPFVAVLGGKGFVDIIQYVRREHGLRFTWFAFAGLLGILAVLSQPLTDNALTQWRGVAAYYGGPAKRSAFNNRFGPYGGGTYSYLADDQVARYLNERTAPNDKIYVYGYEALIYLLSGRDSASRFFYVFPVISTWSPPDWQAEFYDSLRAKAPQYLLIQANEGAPWITGLHEDTGRYAVHDSELQHILADRYRLETKIEDFTIYRLRD